MHLKSENVVHNHGGDAKEKSGRLATQHQSYCELNARAFTPHTTAHSTIYDSSSLHNSYTCMYAFRAIQNNMSCCVRHQTCK